MLPHPYGTVENWKNDVKLIPDVPWGDMYYYLVNSLNEYTHGNLKAYKLPVAFNFLYATMFKTFIIMKLQKNLHFWVFKQRYKNIHCISSNKRWTSYMHHPLISAALWRSHLEIGASLKSLPSNKCRTYKCSAC